MITPISSNINSNALSSIERPRVPRRMSAADNVSFSGKSGSSKATLGIKGGISKAFNTVKKAIGNLVHSKPVQAVKKGISKGFHKTVDVIKNIPKATGNFFKKIANKFTKKA